MLLDGGLLLERPDLRASEEALRRWSAAVALVRPAGEGGGRVVLNADPQAPAAQALVRGDVTGHAERELAEREALGLPPAVAMAEVSGGAAAVRSFEAALQLPEGAELLGPLPVGARRPAGGEEGTVRMLARAPRDRAGALAAALHAAAAVRSARRDTGAVRVQVDPRDVG